MEITAILLILCVDKPTALVILLKCMLKVVNLLQLLVALYVVVMFVDLASGAMQMVLFIASMCPCCVHRPKPRHSGRRWRLCVHVWLAVSKLLLLLIIITVLGNQSRVPQCVNCKWQARLTATLLPLALFSSYWQLRYIYRITAASTLAYFSLLASQTGNNNRRHSFDGHKR